MTIANFGPKHAIVLMRVDSLFAYSWQYLLPIRWLNCHIANFYSNYARVMVICSSNKCRKPICLLMAVSSADTAV